MADTEINKMQYFFIPFAQKSCELPEIGLTRLFDRTVLQREQRAEGESFYQFARRCAKIAAGILKAFFIIQPA